MKHRLIDANEYCEFLNTYPLEKAQSNFMTFYRDVLQHTFECEVKAIPIEWIEEWQKRHEWKDEWEYVSYCTMADGKPKYAIECMLEDWREENEINN